jgi:hypothetical protein
LRKDGYFGYILPSKFMKVSAGSKLRGYLSSNKYISEIISFGANQVFEKKTTYTCILIARKNKIGEFSYVRVDDIAAWKVRDSITLHADLIDSQSLTSGTWVLGKAEYALLEAIKRKTTPLGELIGEKSIANGIQTSANNVYIHSIKSEDFDFLYFDYAGKEYKVEKKLTRPYFKTVQGNDGLYTYRNLIPNSFVIYPYKRSHGGISFVKYEELNRNYPCLSRFLHDVKNKLEAPTRSVKPVPATSREWYRYGRSQALENCDVPIKIVVGVLSSGYKYSIDTKRTFISSGGTAGYCLINVPEDSPYSIYYFQALLSSKYLEWFASLIGEVFRGGFIARGTKVLNRMPIVPIDFSSFESKRYHDDIASLQQELNGTFGEIDENRDDSRVRIPLQRKFNRVKSLLDARLAALFDLGVLEGAVPSVEEIYHKDD